MPVITSEESSKKDTITANVEKLVYGGEGLARVDGQVLLTPFVLPGEQIEVTAHRAKAGLLRGTFPRILQASPHRITPRCQYFANCGGCQYQHAEYAMQLEAKRDIFRETLQRLGGISYEDEIQIISGKPWNYRNRIQLHFDEQRAGFRKAESHDLCPITHCEISSPFLNEVIAKLNDAARRREWPKFLRSLEVFTNEEQVQLNVLDSTQPVAARFFSWCESFLPTLVFNSIDYLVGEHSFRISRGSFFQVNRFLINELVDSALRDAVGDRALDLYAGVGLFTSPLARRFQTVDAVERSGPAFRDLQWNASSHSNVYVTKTAAHDFLLNITEVPDLIVADPPRAGLGQETAKELLRVASPRITYISCDAATLARDLRTLLENYTIERLTLLDLFPQTFHFEIIAHLQRK